MSLDNDSWLRAAFEPARRLEPTEAEVARALARSATGRRARSPFAPAGRTVAVAALGLLLAATAAAAATGLLPIGSVFRGEGFHENGRKVKETLAATGTLAKLGDWRMTTFATKEGTQCLKLELLDRAGRRVPGPAKSGYCGWVGAFSEFGVGRRAAAAERGQVLLFGTAPEQARSVELTGNGGVEVGVAAQPGPDGRRYWVLAAPAGLSKADLAWLDAERLPRGSLDVGYRFSGPTAPTVVASGRAPIAGPWRMTAYESGRSVVDGDLYQPEGLPCLQLGLLDPPNGHPQRGGGCGVQPKTPGFTRGQARYPNVGRPDELLMYGRAPDRADSVEVRAGGSTFSTPTRPGPDGVPGRFWLIARPPADFKGGHVYWVDRDGGARGRLVEVLPP